MIVGARQEAEAAKRAARPDSHAAPKRHGLFIAVVTEVQANGTYKVQVHDDEGANLESYEYVRCVPSTTALAVDSVVWLVFQDGAPVPVIMAGSSGSGGDDCGVVVD